MRKTIRVISTAILCVMLSVVVVQLNAAPSAYKWRFSKSGDFLGWKPEGFRKAAVTGGAVRGTTNQLSFLYSPILNLDADKNQAIYFTAKASASGTGSVYFSKTGEPFGEERKVSFEITGDNVFRTYAVPMKGSPRWTGTIEQVRFDILYVPNARVEIRQLGFAASTDEVGADGAGSILLNSGFGEESSGGRNRPDRWRTVGKVSLARRDEGNLACLLSAKEAAISQDAAFDKMGTYEFSIDYQVREPVAPGKLTVSLKFLDILDNPLKEQVCYELPLTTSGQWSGFSKTLALHRLAASGEMEIRFQSPSGKSSVAVDNVKLKPTGNVAANATAPAVVAEKASTPSGVPKVKLGLMDGVPSLFIDGRKLTTINYLLDNPDAKEHIANCRDNGIHTYMLNVRTTPWNGADGFDFTDVDKSCESILAEDPQGYIFLIVPLDNQINPGLRPWLEAHPDDRVCHSTGSPDIPDYGGSTSTAPSMASKNWQEMAEDLMRRLVRHTRSSRYGERIIGYMPANGVSYEWQQWASVAWPPLLVDYSESGRQAFVEWLKAKYNNVAALNDSWKMDYKSFDAIAIPSKEDRTRSDLFTFLDPEKSMREIDFRQYYSELVADCILRLAKAIKEESKGESLCGVYYGYVMHVLGPYRYQLVGHSALHKALNSPYLDFLMSPSDYGDRQIGGASGFMSTTDSVRLHNKVWIDQADLRTHHSTLVDRVTSLADSKAAMIRHFGNALASGCAQQLYDFSAGWTSGDPRLMQLAGKLAEIEQNLLDVKHGDGGADDSIAVIVDEKSTYYTAMPSAIHFDGIVWQYVQLARTGVGFDTYLLDDLENMRDYKCYLFLNTFRITKEQQAFIDSHLKKAGKTLIFVYAPGITDEQKLLPERVAEITGVGVEVVNKEISLKTTTTTSKDPVLRYLKTGRQIGSDTPHGPVMVPKDGKVLGTIDALPGKPGLVVKRNPDWTSVFSVAPNLPPELLRGIAENAGVRVADPVDGDITYTGGRLITIHTLTGGPRKLRCEAKSGTVTELVTGKTFAVKDGVFKVNLPPRSTTLFLTPQQEIENRSKQ